MNSDEQYTTESTTETQQTEESTTGPLIDVSNASFVFGSLTALENVSLTIDSGTVTALIGPNGAGKSTLLRSIAGLVEPTDGSIDYQGPDAVRAIGYLPQRPAFRPGFTALETLSFYASLVAEDDTPQTYLERVGLSEAANRPVETLSGGMTRLLGIAQATIGDPPLIVLDEPASGLDPGMRTHVFDVLTDLARDGTGVVVSSHDLTLVDRSADTIVLLDDGMVREAGPPTAIWDRLGVESTQKAYETAIPNDRQSVQIRTEDTVRSDD